MLTLLPTGCGGPAPDVGLKVSYPPELTRMPDGTFVESNRAGLKRVRVDVEPGPNLLLSKSDGVRIVFRFRQTDEREAAGLPEPGSKTTFYFDLPYSEYLKLCERMSYRWVIDYEDTRSSVRTTYQGEQRFVMPVENGDGTAPGGGCK